MARDYLVVGALMRDLYNAMSELGPLPVPKPSDEADVMGGINAAVRVLRVAKQRIRQLEAEARPGPRPEPGRQQHPEWTDAAMQQLAQELRELQRQLKAARAESAALREDNHALQRRLCCSGGHQAAGAPCPELLSAQASEAAAARQLHELELRNASLLAQQLQLVRHDRAAATLVRTSVIQISNAGEMLCSPELPREEVRRLGMDMRAVAWQIGRLSYSPSGDMPEQGDLVQVSQRGLPRCARPLPTGGCLLRRRCRCRLPAALNARDGAWPPRHLPPDPWAPAPAPAELLPAALRQHAQGAAHVGRVGRQGAGPLGGGRGPG
jgi:hypothetical protein